jgi:3-oxoacyl-[acyl-carrier-protein] synthase II
MRALRRRVVVTGIGVVSPLGNTAQDSWRALVAGESGIGPITRFDPSGLPARIAGEVRNFDPLGYLDTKEVRRMDRFAHLAVAAAQMAVADAGLEGGWDDPERVGVVIGSGMGGIETLEESIVRFHDGGFKKVSPFFIPRVISNMAPGHIAIRFGALGVNYATTSACASGGHAIGEAFRLIGAGAQDVMIAGGAEAGVTSMCIAGFAAMRALSTRNDEPATASRPFERDRDGFVVAEGAGVLVLEDLDHARARGARVYAEIVGYGANADAYHITTPAPEGAGAARCIRLTLADAELAPEDIDYINAHGTATEYNDVNETQAVKAVFGEAAGRIAISSTKSMTGHALGAAGGLEAAFSVLAIDHQIAPPTTNYEHPDPQCDLDYVPNRARSMKIDAALSNSFGFGGANSCLAFRRFSAA